jgi:hypothetical protein
MQVPARPALQVAGSTESKHRQVAPSSSVERTSDVTLQSVAPTVPDRAPRFVVRDLDVGTAAAFVGRVLRASFVGIAQAPSRFDATWSGRDAESVAHELASSAHLTTVSRDDVHVIATAEACLRVQALDPKRWRDGKLVDLQFIEVEAETLLTFLGRLGGFGVRGWSKDRLGMSVRNVRVRAFSATLCAALDGCELSRNGLELPEPWAAPPAPSRAEAVPASPSPVTDPDAELNQFELVAVGIRPNEEPMALVRRADPAGFQRYSIVQVNEQLSRSAARVVEITLTTLTFEQHGTVSLRAPLRGGN